MLVAGMYDKKKTAKKLPTICIIIAGALSWANWKKENHKLSVFFSQYSPLSTFSPKECCSSGSWKGQFRRFTLPTSFFVFITLLEEHVMFASVWRYRPHSLLNLKTGDRDGKVGKLWKKLRFFSSFKDCIRAVGKAKSIVSWMESIIHSFMQSKKAFMGFLLCFSWNFKDA